MTDPQRTLIAVLLDRSGSMQVIKDDTEGGFNAFVEQQRNEPGEARVTLANRSLESEIRPMEELEALARPGNPRPDRYGD